MIMFFSKKNPKSIMLTVQSRKEGSNWLELDFDHVIVDTSFSIE